MSSCLCHLMESGGNLEDFVNEYYSKTTYAKKTHTTQPNPQKLLGIYKKRKLEPDEKKRAVSKK